MEVRLIVASLTACWLLIGLSPVVAQDGSGFRTWAEQRAYHACLYADWIDTYCRYQAWGASDWSFQNCVIANDACGCVIASGGHWGTGVDDACRAVFQPRRHGTW